MLMLVVLFCIAMCMQACSGPASEDDSSRRPRQRSTAAAASQEEDADMHDRCGRPLCSATPCWVSWFMHSCQELPLTYFCGCHSSCCYSYLPTVLQQLKGCTSRADGTVTVLCGHRFLKTMWQIDPEACVLDLAVHGSETTGKYLVMLILLRDKFLKGTAQSQHHHSRQTGLGAAPAKVPTGQACRNCLAQFAQLRQNLKKEKRMAFVVAEQRMLNSAAWSRLYVDAVKTVNCASPIVLWHPKRNKCQIFDSMQVQTCQHALEQTLDGNVRKWLHRPWPT